MERKIKDIYSCKCIDNADTNLLKHINRILNKTISELDVSDICVLIRQEMFLDTAVPKAIELIKIDHAVGDNYNYSLLYNLSNISSPLIEFADKLSELISVLERDEENEHFELEEEKADYCESIARIRAKINK